MFIFPVYAMISLYAIGLNRRRWLGYALAIACPLLILLAMRLLDEVARWTNGAFKPGGIKIMFYPYAILLFMAGAFLSLLPRAKPAVGHCEKCGYDLAGLERDMPLCPECGFSGSISFDAPATSVTVIAASENPALAIALAHHDAPDHAHTQHERRQTGDEQPAERPARLLIDLNHARERAGARALGDQIVLPREPVDRGLEKLDIAG